MILKTLELSALVLVFAVVCVVVTYLRNCYFRRTVHTAFTLTGKFLATVLLIVATPLYGVIGRMFRWTGIAPVEALSARVLARNIGKGLWLFGFQAVAAWVAVALFIPMWISQSVMRAGNIATTHIELIEPKQREA